jgi:biotin operon repressor
MIYLTETPQTKRELASKMGCTTRDVELHIQAARLEGAPIVSNGDGYWLGTPQEVADCARRLRRRAITQLLTARALRRAASRANELVLGL